MMTTTRFKVWLWRNRKAGTKAVLVWCEGADDVLAEVAAVEPGWEVRVACPWPEGTPEPHATTEEVWS